MTENKSPVYTSHEDKTTHYWKYCDKSDIDIRNGCNTSQH